MATQHDFMPLYVEEGCAPVDSLWATEGEARESRLAEWGVECPICGAPVGACYFICPNSPLYYSADEEREHDLYVDSLPQSIWKSLAVAEYERFHGPGSYCS